MMTSLKRERVHCQVQCDVEEKGTQIHPITNCSAACLSVQSIADVLKIDEKIASPGWETEPPMTSRSTSEEFASDWWYAFTPLERQRGKLHKTKPGLCGLQLSHQGPLASPSKGRRSSLVEKTAGVSLRDLTRPQAHS